MMPEMCAVDIVWMCVYMRVYENFCICVCGSLLAKAYTLFSLVSLNLPWSVLFFSSRPTFFSKHVYISTMHRRISSSSASTSILLTYLSITQLVSDFLNHGYRRVERDMGGYRKLDEEQIISVCALYIR